MALLCEGKGPLFCGAAHIACVSVKVDCLTWLLRFESSFGSRVSVATRYTF